MTPVQPSLLDAVAEPPPAMPRKPRKAQTVDAPICQCGTYLLPGDYTAHDGRTYCRSCWAELPAWMRFGVPISQWPRGWKKIAGVKR